MREIIFRGKRLDNGEWAEGYFVNLWMINYQKHQPIITDNNAVSYDVDPSTIGQYTGLKDKNGKRIFEGDIIKSDNGAQSSISVVKFGEYYPKMFYNMLDMFMPGVPHLNANGFYAVSTKHEDMILFKSRYFEIIGNIHDNKSLLNNQEAGE